MIRNRETFCLTSHSITDLVNKKESTTIVFVIVQFRSPHSHPHYPHHPKLNINPYTNPTHPNIT